MKREAVEEEKTTVIHTLSTQADTDTHTQTYTQMASLGVLSCSIPHSTLIKIQLTNSYI